ncbi:MAG: DUF1801 domain-containing protein [Saprospiraceae bacterium]|nr:DUF1801 domain-containing protein [Saprospiraceae bacterium]
MIKTQAGDTPIENLFESLDDKKKSDAQFLHAMMQEITGEPGSVWGKDLIGYGTYTYTTRSGEKNEWFLTGFSPRKSKFSLYIISGVESDPDLIAKLGKYKNGKSCLYINKLEDVNIEVLKSLIIKGFEDMKQKSKDGIQY